MFDRKLKEMIFNTLNKHSCQKKNTLNKHKRKSH